ncbi:MAG: type 1 glutamine amidotransferase domain-containing protein [Alkalispirochaeta sp.]
MNDPRIAMLVGPGFEDLEHWAVYMRMKELGGRIRILGTVAGETYTSKHGGLTATAEKAASEVTAEEFDAVLVPGGWAPDKLRRDQGVLRLVRDAHAGGLILGFICHAGWVAASAGIVKGMSVTGSGGIRDDMVNAGATWSDVPALRDGNTVWGRVVEDIPDYNRELARALGER